MFNEIFYEKTKKQNASLLYEKLLKTYNYKKTILNESFKSTLSEFFTKNSLKNFLQGLTNLAEPSVREEYRRYAREIVDSSISGISREAREELIADVTDSVKRYKTELAKITDEGKYELKEEEFHLEVERKFNETIKGRGIYRDAAPPLPTLLQGEPAEVALRFVPPSLERTAEKNGLRAEVVKQTRETIERKIQEVGIAAATGDGSITSKTQLNAIIETILGGIQGEGASEAKQDVRNWLLTHTPYTDYESDVLKLAAGTAESKQAVAAARTAGSAPSILTSMRANFKARPKRYVAKRVFITGLIIAAVIGVMKAIDAYKLSGRMKEVNRRCMNEKTFFTQYKSSCDAAAKYVAGVKTAEVDISEALKAADAYAKQLEDDKETQYAIQQATITAESGTSTTGEKNAETASTPGVTELGKVYEITIKDSPASGKYVMKTGQPNKFKYVDAKDSPIGNEFALDDSQVKPR